ncbi:metalloregulator ArsR/SmtB family transcription factor [Raineyella sp.]|uniref:ArsR/SmtB family transcription factor n=1 Tax=Raineyella sp. TaxID=1911550 RepID=UPI002B21DFD9|nr:metalloregulator ArsR/SmtB family transcription factor [Raineyella sp.]MEA5155833.1 metalloregulator ArsR/SmtB family transcription factor [Raineyella sp.]
MSRISETSVFTALGHPTRRAVLAYLRDRDYVRVTDIAEAVGVGGSTLSGHLRTLRAAELVVSRRRGTEIQYRVNLTVIDEAMLLLASLGGALHQPRPHNNHDDTAPEEER